MKTKKIEQKNEEQKRKRKTIRRKTREQKRMRMTYPELGPCMKEKALRWQEEAIGHETGHGHGGYPRWVSGFRAGTPKGLRTNCVINQAVRQVLGHRVLSEYYMELLNQRDWLLTLRVRSRVVRPFRRLSEVGTESQPVRPCTGKMTRRGHYS